MDAHLSCRRDYLLSEKADRFIVESKQLDLIRTKIGKHDAIDPQTFLRWNEASDKEKIKQKTGKRLKKPQKISLKCKRLRIYTIVAFSFIRTFAP